MRSSACKDPAKSNLDRPNACVKPLDCDFTGNRYGLRHSAFFPSRNFFTTCDFESHDVHPGHVHDTIRSFASQGGPPRKKHDLAL
jgi:hypothetical protein